MTALLSLHLLSIGIWIGVVAAEFVIEFDGMKDEESLIRAAKLHYSTDKWVEIPAFTTALVTGLLMIRTEHLSGLFLAKIIFALLAISFNVICIVAVFRRRKFAIQNDVVGMESTNGLMRLGALIIPFFIIAFALAAYLTIAA